MKLSATPKVSVVMPVHNALPYLDTAVESILCQSYGAFEFVILDDASNDGSSERLRYWASQDCRIRLLVEPRNLGPAMSSDRVARAALAPIVARMDADDISYPDRLREELAVFEDHPRTGVVACLCDFVDCNGRRLRGSEQWRLARRSPFVPFAHGAMMYRREVFEQAGGYRRGSEYWEDQDLVTRMSRIAPVMVVPSPLYRVRLSSTSTRAASDAASLEHAVDIMYRSTERTGDLRAANDPDKLDPRVFISLGSQLLWAGGRPHLFRRLLDRGMLALNIRTATALVWTAWASLEPRSLRIFLRSLLFARNIHASLKMRFDGPVPWSSSNAVPEPDVASRRARPLFEEQLAVQSSGALRARRRAK